MHSFTWIRCLQNNSFLKDESFLEDKWTEDDSMMKVVMYIKIIYVCTANNNNPFRVIQRDPSMVELVSGYGVYCAKRQQDEALSSSRSATHLIRHLLPIFFSQTTVAAHSCDVHGLYSALDSRIVAACIGKFYYMNIYNIKLLAD